MDTQDQVNYTPKNIREFTPNDTIYIRKIVNDFSFAYYCQFVKYEKGIVHAKIISVTPDYIKLTKGKEITSHITKCYLWGNNSRKINWNHCIWFDKDGFAR